MKVKVLYNTKGKVLSYWNAESDVDLSGNLYLEVEIPDNKNIDYIDLSGDEPVPVYKNKGQSEAEKLQALEAKVELIALMADIELPEEE